MGTVGRVAEEPGFSPHDKRANRVLRVVVGNWDSSVEKEGARRLLFAYRVSNRLVAGVGFQTISASTPLSKFIQDRFAPFLTLIKPRAGRQVVKFPFQHEECLRKTKPLLSPVSALARECANTGYRFSGGSCALTNTVRGPSLQSLHASVGL